jgi:hypothetical protein
MDRHISGQCFLVAQTARMFSLTGTRKTIFQILFINFVNRWNRTTENGLPRNTKNNAINNAVYNSSYYKWYMYIAAIFIWSDNKSGKTTRITQTEDFESIARVLF